MYEKLATELQYMKSEKFQTQLLLIRVGTAAAVVGAFLIVVFAL